MASELVKLTGLWSGTDKNGNQTLSGNLNGSARIVIFHNQHKEKETDPDMIAYITKNEKRENAGT